MCSCATDSPSESRSRSPSSRRPCARRTPPRAVMKKKKCPLGGELARHRQRLERLSRTLDVALLQQRLCEERRRVRIRRLYTCRGGELGRLAQVLDRLVEPAESRVFVKPRKIRTPASVTVSPRLRASSSDVLYTSIASSNCSHMTSVSAAYCRPDHVAALQLAVRERAPRVFERALADRSRDGRR